MEGHLSEKWHRSAWRHCFIFTFRHCNTFVS